jgi:hypothetical protein
MEFSIGSANYSYCTRLKGPTLPSATGLYPPVLLPLFLFLLVVGYAIACTDLTAALRP